MPLSIWNFLVFMVSLKLSRPKSGAFHLLFVFEGLMNTNGILFMLSWLYSSKCAPDLSDDLLVCPNLVRLCESPSELFGKLFFCTLILTFVALLSFLPKFVLLKFLVLVYFSWAILGDDNGWFFFAMILQYLDPVSNFWAIIERLWL